MSKTPFCETPNFGLEKVQNSLIRFIDSIDEGFELLELIFDNQGIAIDFVFLKVNPAFEKLTGLKAANIIGKRKKENAPTSDQKWYDFAIRAVKTGKTLHYDYYNDKVNRYFETQFIPISTTQIAVIFKDVTKRKKTEEELNEMQYRLTIAKDAAKIGIYDYYISSGRVYWDKRVRDIWGIPEDETVTFEMFLSVLHPDDRKLIDWSVFSPENRTFNVEYRVINKQDGAIRWVKATGTFFFEGTRPIRLIGTIEDISSQKNLEQKIKDQDRLSAIGATAGMVGHDIRNPLQAVLSDTYLIKDELASMPEGENKEGVAESIESIERNVAYINKIVQDLQDYARQIVPEYSITDLSDVLMHVFETISIPESINFSINVKDVGKIRVDPSLVQRAITNLVNNAIQAMPNGGKLEICGEKIETRIVVTVSDTGEGIPDEVKPKLFTPMMTTKAKGQGFGLAASKRIIEAMKGTIKFESEKGKGTKFIIELPTS